MSTLLTRYQKTSVAVRRGTTIAAVTLTVAAVVYSFPADAQSPPSRSSWDGVYTLEQAARGQAGYSVACLSCHGEQLDGFDAAPGLRGGRFLSSWNGVNLGDMLERTRITMPLESPGTLSRQEVADVLAYILSMNGFPAGEGELPRQTAILRGISFEAMQP